MKTLAIRALLCVAILSLMMTSVMAAAKDNPMVTLRTNKGDITIELYPNEAPLTVQNFLWYVDNGFYDGLIFHRVIKDFMIQGGGFTPEMQKKAGNPEIENEAANGLKNEKGTIAMARTAAVHSASSQFFINLKDNNALDHRNKTPQGFGYCVFGKVVEGIEVVEEIGSTETGSRKGYNDVPTSTVSIKKAFRKEAKAKKTTEKKK